MSRKPFRQDPPLAADGPLGQAHGASGASLDQPISKDAGATPPSGLYSVAHGGKLPPGALACPAPPFSDDADYGGNADYASEGSSASGVAPLAMPQVLKQHCQEFETWAETNQKDERRDRAKYWTLKLPAIAVTSAASLLALWNVQMADAIFAFVGALCIAIDAIMKPGKMRNVHWRAVHDLRRIQHEIKYAWNARSLALGEKPSQEDLRNLAAEIIEFARREHIRVHDYLLDAETAI